VASASSHTTSAASAGSGGCVRQRAREKVDAEVGAVAGADQLLDLRIGLGRAQPAVDRDHDQLGDEQPEAPGQLADDHLGHQRPQALPGAPELGHIQPVVIGLDQPRQ
jgi:hypothetical protein